jgi:alanine racemase
VTFQPSLIVETNVNPTQEPFERVAEIDLANIRHNVKRLAALAAPAKLMAVVKADAYGHGALPVARVALESGAAWLGTAHVSEALPLRENGIEAPLLAWLHTRDTNFEAAILADIDLGVSGWELPAIAAAADRAARTARIHIKVDTGLGRNGATMERLPSLLQEAAGLQEAGKIRVVGVFSHLAVADEPSRPETDEQIRVFREAVRLTEAAGFHLEARHLANTPGTLSRPDAHFDLVRCGIGLYGLSPFTDQSSEDLGLKPAMTLKVRVANAKRVNADQGVSYGLNYKTTEDTVLVDIPVGYADGIPRAAAYAPVVIDGKLFRSAGRVAMDQFIMDVGPDQNPEELMGKYAVLFGENGPHVDEWAAACGTINYEIVTRISGRVPRRYIDGGWGRTGD